jgi:hypothetical protein
MPDDSETRDDQPVGIRCTSVTKVLAQSDYRGSRCASIDVRCQLHPVLVSSSDEGNLCLSTLIFLEVLVAVPLVSIVEV